VRWLVHVVVVIAMAVLVVGCSASDHLVAEVRTALGNPPDCGGADYWRPAARGRHVSFAFRNEPQSGFYRLASSGVSFSCPTGSSTDYVRFANHQALLLAFKRYPAVRRTICVLNTAVITGENFGHWNRLVRICREHHGQIIGPPEAP
jgi:hypothetical protein